MASKNNLGCLSTYKKDGKRGITIALTREDIFTIGKSATATIRLKSADSDILDIHCKINVHENGCATITNRCVFNPIQVNGINCLKAQILKSEDVIKVGTKLFKYENKVLDQKTIDETPVYKKKMFHSPRRQTISATPVVDKKRCSVLHEGPNLQTPDVEKTDLIDFNTPENNASVVELNTPDLVHLPKNRKAKILSKLSKSLVTFDSPNANIVKKNLSASVICLDTPVKTSESPFKTPSLPIRSSVKKKLLENKLSHTLQETPDFKSRLSSTPVETRSILKSDCTPERHLDRSRKSLRFASAEHDVSNEDFKDLCGSTPIAPSKYQKSVIQELSQVPEDDSNGSSQSRGVLSISASTKKSLNVFANKSIGDNSRSVQPDSSQVSDDESLSGVFDKVNKSRRKVRRVVTDVSLATTLDSSRNSRKMSSETIESAKKIDASRRSLRSSNASLNEHKDSKSTSSFVVTKNRSSSLVQPSDTEDIEMVHSYEVISKASTSFSLSKNASTRSNGNSLHVENVSVRKSSRRSSIQPESSRILPSEKEDVEFVDSLVTNVSRRSNGHALVEDNSIIEDAINANMSTRSLDASNMTKNATLPSNSEANDNNMSLKNISRRSSRKSHVEMREDEENDKTIGQSILVNNSTINKSRSFILPLTNKEIIMDDSHVTKNLTRRSTRVSMADSVEVANSSIEEKITNKSDASLDGENNVFRRSSRKSVDTSKLEKFEQSPSNVSRNSIRRSEGVANQSPSINISRRSARRSFIDSQKVDGSIIESSLEEATTNDSRRSSRSSIVDAQQNVDSTTESHEQDSRRNLSRRSLNTLETSRTSLDESNEQSSVNEETANISRSSGKKSITSSRHSSVHTVEDKEDSILENDIEYIGEDNEVEINKSMSLSRRSTMFAHGDINVSKKLDESAESMKLDESASSSALQYSFGSEKSPKLRRSLRKVDSVHIEEPTPLYATKTEKVIEVVNISVRSTRDSIFDDTGSTNSKVFKSANSSLTQALGVSESSTLVPERRSSRRILSQSTIAEELNNLNTSESYHFAGSTSFAVPSKDDDSSSRVNRRKTVAKLNEQLHRRGVKRNRSLNESSVMPTKKAKEMMSFCGESFENSQLSGIESMITDDDSHIYDSSKVLDSSKYSSCYSAPIACKTSEDLDLHKSLRHSSRKSTQNIEQNISILKDHKNADTHTPTMQKELVNVSAKKMSKTQKDPSNDLTDVSGVGKLFRTPKVQKAPKNDLTDVQGVKRILRTPKLQKDPKNDLSDVQGVKNMLKTPRPQRGPKNDLSDVVGVKKMLKTPKTQQGPKNDLTDVAGVKKLLKTPKIQRDPRNDLLDVRGVKNILKTPKPQREPNNDLTDVRGVKKILKTPKPQREPNNDLTDVRGVKKFLSTPKMQKEPKNDLTNVQGVKKFLSTPKVQNEPKNDLTNVQGVKRMFAVQKNQRSPLNDLTNPVGIRRLMASPRPVKETANVSFTGFSALFENPMTVENMFDNIMGKPSPGKTYEGPGKKIATPINNSVTMWVQEQNELLHQDPVEELKKSASKRKLVGEKEDSSPKNITRKNQPRDDTKENVEVKVSRPRRAASKDIAAQGTPATPVRVLRTRNASKNDTSKQETPLETPVIKMASRSRGKKVQIQEEQTVAAEVIAETSAKRGRRGKKVEEETATEKTEVEVKTETPVKTVRGRRAKKVVEEPEQASAAEVKAETPAKRNRRAKKVEETETTEVAVEARTETPVKAVRSRRAKKVQEITEKPNEAEETSKPAKRTRAKKVQEVAGKPEVPDVANTEESSVKTGPVKARSTRTKKETVATDVSETTDTPVKSSRTRRAKQVEVESVESGPKRGRPKKLEEKEETADKAEEAPKGKRANNAKKVKFADDDNDAKKEAKKETKRTRQLANDEFLDGVEATEPVRKSSRRKK